MRALVTGASGFIGTAVVKALRAKGYDVHFDRVNLLEPHCARRLMQTVQPDLLVHLAWETTHGQFWDAPANLDWTAATLQLAREFAAAGGKCFVGLGSCAEYSWHNLNGNSIDECSPRAPLTLYGAAKNACFEVLSRFFEHGPTTFAWGRLFLPYGPGDQRPTLVPQLIQSLLAGKPVPLTTGSQVRDFIYVDDAACAIAALAGASTSGAFNICTGLGASVADVALRIAAQTGRPDLLRFGALPTRQGDPPFLVGCASKITSETGWRAQVPLDEGIRETLRWWRASQ
jgi:nucleoside-diphosphate-sugar epimerase